MHKLALLIGLVVFLACRVALAGETISTTELESYFYKDGEMKRSNGQFETTYYMEGNTVTRTRVYDFKYKKVIPDDTVNQIQRQLWSDPSIGGSEFYVQVIRAIGQPGTNAVEILMIGETFIQSVKSTSDYFVISRQKRVK
jgi:hypothetical protein